MQRSRTLPPKAREDRGGEDRRTREEPSRRPARPRFSEWAGERCGSDAVAKAAPLRSSETQEEQHFLIINDLLKSRSRGIKFRNSPNYDDRCKTKVGSFGTMVKGVRYNSEWIKVGKHYLPMKVDGKYVLLRQHVEDAKEDVEDSHRAEEGVNPMLANHLRGKMLAQEQARAEAEAKELRKQQQLEVNFRNREFLMPERQWPQDQPDRGLPPRQPPLQIPVHVPGTGVLYKVLVDVLDVQSEPGENGARVPARAKQKGLILELFDWDHSRKWRLIYENLGRNKPSVPGWVKLDDPQLGPLLRPASEAVTTTKLGGPSRLTATTLPGDRLYSLINSTTPLEPVCVAVHEKNLAHLRKMILSKADLNARDATGLTPLMLAADAGLADFCVYLLEGAADATLTKEEVSVAAKEPVKKAAVDFTDSLPLKALIQALSGAEHFSMPDFDMALETLKPEVAEVAESVLDQIALHKEALRKRQDFAPPPRAAGAHEDEEEDDMETLRKEEEARQEVIRRERELLYKEYEEEQRRLAEAKLKKQLEEKAREDVRQPEAAPVPDRNRDRGEKLRALREQAARRRAGGPPDPDKPAKKEPEKATLWVCADCGFETPSTRSVCDFCDTPRMNGAAVI